MASIPGTQFSVTGATGSQGVLAPMGGWTVYILPRGGWASQASAGAWISFDTSSVATRFSATLGNRDWIQVGTDVSSIRHVVSVVGSSIQISGANVTVNKNDRIFIVGKTQPSVSGSVATYVPNSTIRQRDDDTSDQVTNSALTTDSNGHIAFYGQAGLYDALVQDGNGLTQGYFADIPVGTAEGVSTGLAATFGATATFNGWAVFGQTVTMNANAGVTGTLTVGNTLTASANLVLGATVSGGTISALNGIVGGLTITTGIFGVSDQPRCLVTRSADVSGQSFPASATLVKWGTEQWDVGNFYSVAGSSTKLIIPTGYGGFYMILAQVFWNGTGVGGQGQSATHNIEILKNGATTVAQTIGYPTAENGSLVQQAVAIDAASAADYYEVRLTHSITGSTCILSPTNNRSAHQFGLIKLS